MSVEQVNPFEFDRPIYADCDGITCVGIWLGGAADEWCVRVKDSVSKAEWERAQRFVHDRDAARHLVGRALVRAVIAKIANKPQVLEEFTVNPWGKLSLDGSSIGFSISHSGDMVWAAFCSQAPVGIDVEYNKPLPNLGELGVYFHPMEEVALRKLSGQQALRAFYRCWVRKEAVAKATGRGLSLPLTSFQVMIDKVPGDWLYSASNTLDGGWTSRDVIVPEGYYCSVAARSPDQKMTAYMLNDLPLKVSMV